MLFGRKPILTAGEAMSTKLLLPLMLVSFFCLAPRASSQGQNQPEAQLPEASGEEIVQAAWAACHSLNQVSNAGHNSGPRRTVPHPLDHDRVARHPAKSSTAH